MARWGRRPLGRRGSPARVLSGRDRPRRARGARGRRRPQLLDVRDALELRDDGHIPGAIEIALDDLSGRLAEVSREVPVTVFCKSGARASIAASLLDGQGYDVRLVGVGGALEL